MKNRTPLQTEADQIDCNLYRVISQIEQLVDRTPAAAAKLRAAAHKLRSARGDVRRFMHPSDREVTW